MRTSGRRRHVVILDENLPVPLDRRVWLEAQALREAGFEVTVIGPRGRADMARLREHREGIRILRYPQRAASGLAGYVIEYIPSMLFTTGWLLALRAVRRIDAIHGCNPPDLFFLHGLLARLWGARYVYDQHDANPELAAAKWGDRRLGGVLLRLTNYFERRSYATASAVIVPNDTYARIARERGGVAPEAVHVVRNAPPSSRFQALAEGHAPPDDGRFHLGYLGVMGSQDGVELLVDAVAWLRRERPDLDVQVDLVGDGEARTALEARARAAGVGERLRFHGYRQAEAFVPILAATHLCVSPDPPTPFNHVSTMTKVVEYLALGRPVVTFDLAETSQLVGEAGLIVGEPTAEGLARGIAAVADDRATLASMTAAAATRFATLDLSWERSAERLVAAYRTLLTDSTAAGERPSPSTRTS